MQAEQQGDRRVEGDADIDEQRRHGDRLQDDAAIDDVGEQQHRDRGGAQAGDEETAARRR